MMAIDWTMGSEACAKTDGYCVVFVIFPRFCTVLATSVPEKPGASISSLRMLLLAKTGAVQVSNSCPQTVRMSAGRRNFGIESGAHGRHFNAGKLAAEHDATGLLCPVGQQKPVPTVDCRPRDGLRTRTAIPTCN
jgi:hypothetical protein